MRMSMHTAALTGDSLRKLGHLQHGLYNLLRLVQQRNRGSLGSGAVMQLHSAQDSAIIALFHPHTA